MSTYSLRPNPNTPYEVRYVDAAVLVVEKPAGVVTQPGKGHAHDSLLNGLFSQYGDALQNVGRQRDWGLLHRLDRETSGLVMLALTPRSYDALRSAFEQRRVRKVYWALVGGVPRGRQGTVHQPIAEVTTAQHKLAVIRRGGKPATTAYRVVGTAACRTRRWSGRVSLVECRPATGRLHQIRVHMAWLGCAVLGDDLYGEAGVGPRVDRLCLHAAELSFPHPDGGRRVTVRTDWPADLAQTITRLGLAAPPAAEREQTASRRPP